MLVPAAHPFALAAFGAGVEPEDGLLGELPHAVSEPTTRIEKASSAKNDTSKRIRTRAPSIAVVEDTGNYGEASRSVSTHLLRRDGPFELLADGAPEGGLSRLAVSGFIRSARLPPFAGA